MSCFLFFSKLYHIKEVLFLICNMLTWYISNVQYAMIVTLILKTGYETNLTYQFWIKRRILWCVYFGKNISSSLILLVFLYLELKSGLFLDDGVSQPFPEHKPFIRELRPIISLILNGGNLHISYLTLKRFFKKGKKWHTVPFRLNT